MLRPVAELWNRGGKPPSKLPSPFAWWQLAHCASYSCAPDIVFRFCGSGTPRMLLNSSPALPHCVTGFTSALSRMAGTLLM
ncbi:hypothetical protein D3C85_531400 [compost metagenome]